MTGAAAIGATAPIGYRAFCMRLPSDDLCRDRTASVTLTLSVTSVPSGGTGSIFDLNRALANWGEGNGSDHGGTPGAPGQATSMPTVGPQSLISWCSTII